MPVENGGESWLRRNPQAEGPLAVAVLGCLGLVGLSLLSLASVGGSEDYAKTQGSIFLCLLGGVMIVLVLKPSSMWQNLINGMKFVSRGQPPEGDAAVALVLTGYVLFMALVVIFVLDWSFVSLSRGISGVVGVNLAIVGRALWLKHASGGGSIKRRRL